jgi:transposase
LDVHRTFAEVVVLDRGEVRSGGRVELTHTSLNTFARSLAATDEVVLEATGNTSAIVRWLKPHVARVVVANPLQVRAIAHARVKTDRIDAAILAQLHASGFLPTVWIPDDVTEALRRQVARRSQIVRQRTRLKNEVHSILHAHLIPRCPAADLFGRKGRTWLAEQPLPLDERTAVERKLRELDRLGEDLAVIDRALGEWAVEDPRVHRLMTIAGVNATVAISLVAAIGEIERFPSSQKLVSYFGLNPRVRQSGLQPAQHGRISKLGRSHARAMLVEAAWSAAKTPGPLRAFFLRVRARRGMQIAAVATARKLAVLTWHLLSKDEDYAWARPALVAHKRRQLELRAGQPTRHGQRGDAHDYNLRHIRLRERALVEQAERAYGQMTKEWKRQRPRVAEGSRPIKDS